MISKVRDSQTHATENLQKLFHGTFGGSMSPNKDKFCRYTNDVISEVCTAIAIRIVDERLDGMVSFSMADAEYGQVVSLASKP